MKKKLYVTPSRKELLFGTIYLLLEENDMDFVYRFPVVTGIQAKREY